MHYMAMISDLCEGICTFNLKNLGVVTTFVKKVFKFESVFLQVCSIVCCFITVDNVTSFHHFWCI